MAFVCRVVGLNQGGGCRVHCSQVNRILLENEVQTVTFIPAPGFDDDLTLAGSTETEYRNYRSVFSIFLFFIRERGNIEYVHLHLKNAIIIHGILCHVLRVPFVATIHQAIEFRSARQYLTNFVLSSVLKRSKKVIAISEFIRGQLQMLSVESVLIYNASEESEGLQGYPVNGPKKQSTSRLRIGVIGELTQRKGIADLPSIAEMNPSCNFVVFGAGPLRSILVGQQNIILRGYEANVNDLYSECDAILMLSHFEPFGRVATEAFSRMTPVIGRRSGALPEILLPELLFEKVEEISKILSSLTESKSYQWILENQYLRYQERFSYLIFREKVRENLI